jgi:chorismate dehydratase
MNHRKSVLHGSNRITMSLAKISLGVFSYLNVQPVYYGLLHQQWPDALNFVKGVPSYLNAALLNGEIDLSCVSAAAYAEHYQAFRLLPGLSISAPGAVESVLLFSFYEDWQALDGKKIAVSDHSATAVNLLRVLCKHRYGIEPRFVPMPSNLENMLALCDAALLIGDMALVEGTLHRVLAHGKPKIFDLGLQWAEWTGLPFVFGVWAARADSARTILQSGILEQLYYSKRQGLSHRDEIAREQAPRLGLSVERCAHYLHQMTYDLSEIDQQGWSYFLELSLPGFRWSNIRWL